MPSLLQSNVGGVLLRSVTLFGALFCGVWFSVSASAASKLAPAFPNLATVSADGSKTSMAQVYYAAGNAKLIGKEITDPDSGQSEYLVMTIFLDAARQQPYELYYSEGPSADPYFVLAKPGQRATGEQISGEEIYLPGNGSIYVAAIMNNTFAQHRKYSLIDGQLREVKQPFLYVGMHSVAQRELKIFADANRQINGQEIATIAKGSEVEILLNNGDDFLLRTPFGLVGWCRIANIGLQDEVLQGLQYHGD